MATYFRPLILTAGRSKSAYFSRSDDSKLTANRTLSQLYIDRESAEKAIARYKKRYPMDEIVYSEIEEVDGSRESNPIRLSTKDPSDMSAAEINRELDRISAEDSKVNQEFIDAGRGHEKYWDILKKDDPLSRKALALASRRHKLKIEIERRAGPGMSRLPRGFGPRKNNPLSPVAGTILAQLGGNKFLAMTGAKNLVYGPDMLQFDLPRGARMGISRVRVILEPSDLYRIEFYQVRRKGLDTRMVHELAGIYADQLRELFTKYTGLETSLGTMGRKSNPGRSSLERESSWVIVNRQTGEPILETFQKSVADKVNTKKYEVVPILRWLQRVNRKAREE